MWREADPNVQIAGFGAAGTTFAFSGDANARAFSDPGRNADIHRPRLAVVGDGQPAQRSVRGVLETELQFLLDVASLTGRPGPSAAAASFVSIASGAEEGVEEVGERIGVAEQILHLFRGHR